MSKWINRSERGWINKRKSQSDDFMKSKTPDPDDDDLYGVIYHPLRHPLCLSKNVVVYRTMGNIKYYCCKDCKAKYPDEPKKYCFKVIIADD